MKKHYNYGWYNYHFSNTVYNNYLRSNMQHDRPYAITEHYDDQGHLITRTVVITDGFGRVLQTKKGLTDNGTLSMQVSGRAIVDHFGRTTRQYDNFTVADTTLALLGVYETYIDSTATVTRYDILDRQTRVDQLLGVATQYYYNVANDATNHRRFYTKVTDPNGNVTSPRIQASQNAANLMQHASLTYPTLYASALITFNKGGYTNVTEVESRASSLALPRCSNVTERKHYFEGTNRVCSKIGGGFSNINLDSIEDRVPALAEDYDQQSVRQYESVEHTFNECLSIEIDMGSTIDLYEVIVHETERDDPEPAFFYHSDHLGSAAYLTNDAGQVTQTLNYLPYGEDWVDIQNYAETRYPRLGIYTYNGKDPRKGWRIPLDEIKYNEQKDYESGFHYYGARYYWSEILTGWLSVDPMTDKYPGISPYAYCMWNPINIVDPNGMDTVTVSFDANKKSYSLNYSKGGDNVIIGPNGESQKFDSDVDVCQYRFASIGNNEVSAYMVNVKDGEDPIFGFAVERKSTLIGDGPYNMTQNEKSDIDKNPTSTSKNPKWQGYMVFKGGYKFHWGSSTEWSTGCVVAVGNVELSSQMNDRGWITFDLATSQNACYKVTEYFGGKKGDQNYKFWHSGKNKAITRPAVTWGKKHLNCKWDIRSR